VISKVRFTEGLFLLKGALSTKECDELIAAVERRGFEDAPITTATGFERRPQVRNNTRVTYDDPELARWLWERLAGFMPPELDGWKVVGFNERFRFYRYDPGQRFAVHSDGYYQRQSGERSKLTFMIYLNEEFGGGATEFDATTIRPQAGMALVFRHELVHEGTPVLRGRKYVLRSDVMYAPPGPKGDG
jgi:predicted 2-oxoglutarate/Fe(II)-dependent dioxygenase YbiX